MKLKSTQKAKYLESKGWFTMRSSNNWLNDLIMDDFTLDFGGIRLDQAYDIQKKLEKKDKIK